MSDIEKVIELRRWTSILFDAAVDQGNGESCVPNEDLEDAREAAFGVRANVDEL